MPFLSYLTFLASLLITCTVAAEQPLKDPAPESIHALLVGVGRFSNQPGKQFSSTNDIDCFARRLATSGVKEKSITKLENPTSEEFYRALRSFVNTASKADTIIFFYSGQESIFEGEFMLMPTDGEWGNINKENIPDGKKGNIPLRDITQSLDETGAKNIFVILDTCHCHLVWQPTPIRGNRFIWAGAGPDDEAHDGDTHGAFTKVLLKGLHGSADADRDDKISALELSTYILSRRVEGSFSPMVWGLSNTDSTFLTVTEDELICEHTSVRLSFLDSVASD